MKDRNPALVFAAMPTAATGAKSRETELDWNNLGVLNAVPGFEFIRNQVSGYDAATGRNLLTALALKSEAAFMLMLDSDMHFGPQQVGRLLSGRRFAVKAGVYPKKKISLTQQWVAEFIEEPDSDGLAAVRGVGAGFMLVDLAQLERMLEQNTLGQTFLCEDCEKLLGQSVRALWDPVVVEDDWGPLNNGKWARRLTDDWAFCWRMRTAGYPVVADTLCQVGHIGPVDYLEVMTLVEELTGKKGVSAIR